MDNAVFRQSFPEFANTTRYPDSMLTFWGGLAAKLLVITRWHDFYNEGTYLFVAHNIALQARNVQVASLGGTPGDNSGATSSKSVGQASVSYDNSASMEPDAGHWNLTTYGKQFIQLARIAGSGCVQL